MKRVFFLLLLISTTIGAMAQETYSARRERREVPVAELQVTAPNYAKLDSTLVGKDGFYYLTSAAENMKLASKLEYGGLGAVAVGGVCLAVGYSKDEKALRGVGYAVAAAGIIMNVCAIHFRMRSGKDLKIGAGCIQYNF